VLQVQQVIQEPKEHKEPIQEHKVLRDQQETQGLRGLKAQLLVQLVTQEHRGLREHREPIQVLRVV
jgi:hypothetical protein